MLEEHGCMKYSQSRAGDWPGHTGIDTTKKIKIS